MSFKLTFISCKHRHEVALKDKCVVEMLLPRHIFSLYSHSSIFHRQTTLKGTEDPFHYEY